MRIARLHFLLLWCSQFARSVADNTFRIFAVLQVAELGRGQSDGAWHQVTPFAILPFILLAPVNGAVSNSLPKKLVMAVSAAYCLLIAVLAGSFLKVDSNAWYWCGALACSCLGAAIYSPARYALLPAVAKDALIPLSRVMGIIELGGSAGIVLGMLLGWNLRGQDLLGPFPLAIAAVAGLNLLAVICLLPVKFASDVRRSEGATAAIRGFFSDQRRIRTKPEARGLLLGVAGFTGLLIVGTGAVIAYVLSPDFRGDSALLPQVLIALSLGAAAGSLLASLQGHPCRSLGIVPFASVGLLAAFIWTASTAQLLLPCFLLGLMGGIINVPLRTGYQLSVPADARGNAMSIMNTANYVCGILFALPLFALARYQVVGPTGQLWVLSALALVAIVAAWWYLFREALEQIIELVMWPIYRVRAFGPGVFDFPVHGPVLVVANHTSWMDPVWLGKVVPRRLTPMMTSRFFDLPVLHLIMKKVEHAIRVQASVYRHEAPELKKAMSALEKGWCVAIFPEGFLRRSEEKPIKLFGQGVWHILRERPETQVVVCWIEGGWGSYMSYCKGPPTKNKRMDFWRRISVAISLPQVLDAKLLEDQRGTRIHLMKACLEARRFLGLEPLKLPDGIPDKEDAEGGS